MRGALSARIPHWVRACADISSTVSHAARRRPERTRDPRRGGTGGRAGTGRWTGHTTCPHATARQTRGATRVREKRDSTRYRLDRWDWTFAHLGFAADSIAHRPGRFTPFLRWVTMWPRVTRRGVKAVECVGCIGSFQNPPSLGSRVGYSTLNISIRKRIGKGSGRQANFV
jgi:hypothetical protein